MIQRFDKFLHAEIPTILLCNPNGDELYSISQFIYDDKLSLKFNALSEFSFSIPSTIDNGETELDVYALIQSKRLISISDIGYFLISSVSEKTGGEHPYKEVDCYSIESELVYRKLTSFSGTYVFYDPLNVDQLPGLMDTILEMIPSWTVDEIDAELYTKVRSFNITDKSIYAFLMEDVEKAFQCVFSFDIINKTISVNTVDNATTNTDIYLSYQNLIENTEFKEISEEIVTGLRVYGGNQLSIRGVNPLGGNIIYNFDYYKNSSWMTESLQNALNTWEALIAVYQPTYAAGINTLQTLNEELYDLTYDPVTGLNALLTELSALEAQQQADVTAVPPDPVAIANDAAAIEAKNLEISIKRINIDAKEIEISALESELDAIVDILKIENNFSVDDYKALTLFIYENNYTNENIIQTDTMTISEKLAQEKTLYDQAVVVLEKSSQPRYEFSVNTANFIALQAFATFTAQLAMGAIVTIDISDTYKIETYLLEIDTSFNNPKDFKLVFSNRLRLDSGNFRYSDILGQAVTTSSSVTANTLVWQDWSVNSKDSVTEFITSSLNATTNNIVNSTNQEMVMNSYGLRGRKELSPGIYDPHEMWMTNSVLAFTDDTWQTARLALGQIDTPGGTMYGLIADVIVGKLLAGNTLTITNDDGINVRTFTMNENGATLSNCSFVINNNVSQLILDPDLGIKIQKNESGWVDKFYVEAATGDVFFAGNLSAAGGSFSGDISAATGTFSGAISAREGNIGRWTITDGGLVNSSNKGLVIFEDGSSDTNFGNFVVVQDFSPGATKENWMRFDGNSCIFTGGESLGAMDDFEINTNAFIMNGYFGVSAGVDVTATPNLVFVNGILVEYY